jgi:UDP-N-acetylglucosamine--N-acetylmuramyl-(pentapeptide) pyrophosphoryl-undecaprenol N-acetylglucosamine transferase
VQQALLSAKTNWAKARATAKSELGFSPELPVILITGGSQGSVAINQTILESLSAFESKRVQILHSVGARNALPQSSQLYKPTTYISDMASAYLAADLVIARSGAVTCSEVQALGKYALFIPLPIGNGEQEVNARTLIQAGRAEVVSQKSFSTDWLTKNLDRLLSISAAQSDEGSEADLAAAQKIVALMELAIDEHRS